MGLIPFEVHETGFFSLINTGFTPQEVQRQYDIGLRFFNLKSEEKGRPDNLCDFAAGNYFGYRPVGGNYYLIYKSSLPVWN